MAPHNESICITGGRVFRSNAFGEGEVCMAQGRFTEDTDARTTVDAAGCYVLPGLIDVHFHGCRAHDFCEGTQEAIHAIASWEARRGITAICPATMTYPEEKLARIMDAAQRFSSADGEAALVGINMEGPFISPEKIGAQNPLYVQAPDADMVRRLQNRAGGLIKIVDVAPEVEGALPFIKELSGDVRISIAHTCATYQEADAAFKAGACEVTHLFNAMPGLNHRAPGPIASALEHARVTPEIIADGVHIAPAMVRLAFQMFGADRMLLISDSMMATGMEDGEYELGGQPVTVRGNRATLHDGTIAGSATDLAACLRIAVAHMGIPLVAAVRAATENPARALGIFDERGSIEPGKVADCVILDADLQVRDVFVRGMRLQGI